MYRKFFKILITFITLKYKKRLHIRKTCHDIILNSNLTQYAICQIIILPFYLFIFKYDSRPVHFNNNNNNRVSCTCKFL